MSSSVRIAVLAGLVLPVAACAARAEEAVPTYECTSFPVRSTAAMTAFQAPADLVNARINTTKLPPGWEPVGGTVGEGGAFVLACRSSR